MIDKKRIEKEIRKGLRKKTIRTEADAKAIANRYIKNEPDYQATIEVSNLLSKRVGLILKQDRYKHPWFRGKVTRTLYIDRFDRMWSMTKGVIKTGVPTCYINGDYSLDTLGGSMWRSKKGRTFTCRYRTTEEESKQSVLPETFV